MKTEVKLINSKVLERNMSISVYIPKGYETKRTKEIDS